MKTNVPLATLGWLILLVGLLPMLRAAEEVAVIKEPRVNVRGQPSLVGEVITQVQKGEKVLILEEIAVSKPKTNEPARWARIQMPPNTPVWVFAPFVDLTNKTVRVPRLNLRGGPGENYSVVGRLEKGNPISEIRRVGDWVEIETPAGAYGFVAANLLTKTGESGAARLAKTTPPSSPPPVATAGQGSKAGSATGETKPPPLVSSPATVSTNRPAAEEKVAAAAPATTPAHSPAIGQVPPPVSSAVPPSEAEKKVDLAKVQPEPKSTAPLMAENDSVVVTRPKTEPQSADALSRRVVRREGIVRSTVSIQAPTYHELLSFQNRKTINYLHADPSALKLKDYKGRRVVVTGEEAIDPRWPKTPVIEVETLELIP